MRYEAVNAMSLNEFLYQHHTVEEQQITSAELKSALSQQRKQIDALMAGLQNVSRQVGVNKTAPKLATEGRASELSRASSDRPAPAAVPTSCDYSGTK